MTFTSVAFYLFLAISLTVYYVMPLNKRWTALLFASLFFYASADYKSFVFILLSCASVYFATVKMQSITDKYNDILRQADERWKKENKKRINRQSKKEKKRYFVWVLAANIAILAVLKYLPFLVNSIIDLSGVKTDFRLKLLLPLGISFYTFQLIAYTIDVYYAKVTAERNFFKLMLFTSFFPQVIQGPISKFGQLMPQLCDGNRLKFDNIKFGSQLILWGLFKKMLLSDMLIVLTSPVLQSPENYTGVQVLIGAVLSYIQLYGDFSGGIDITRGVAQMFGIDMIQNFNNPFFATSITDYWRRWHISLGNFMRDYVMMPLNLSKPMVRIGRWGRNTFGVNIGKLVPVFVSTFSIFILVGIWHGPNLKYLVFGAINGLVVSLESIYNAVKEQKAHGKFFSAAKYIISLVYTEFIVFIINTISMSPTLKQSFTIFKNIIFDFHILNFKSDLLILLEKLRFPVENLLVVVAVFGVVLLVEIFKELGFEIRKTIDKQNILIIYAVYLFMIFMIFVCSRNTYAPQGFAYAVF